MAQMLGSDQSENKSAERHFERAVFSVIAAASDMTKLTRCILVILTGSFFGLGSGCGTKSTAPTVIVDAKTLPGADEVTAALEKKDYDGAMAALLKVKQS